MKFNFNSNKAAKAARDTMITIISIVTLSFHGKNGWSVVASTLLGGGVVRNKTLLGHSFSKADLKKAIKEAHAPTSLQTLSLTTRVSERDSKWSLPNLLAPMLRLWRSSMLSRHTTRRIPSPVILSSLSTVSIMQHSSVNWQRLLRKS
jgi:hypothetical protein